MPDYSAASNLAEYYRQRRFEYESIYAKPERQSDLSHAIGILQQIFAGQSLLEVACGTGFWTELVSHTALTIKATDINKEVIDFAKEKNYSCDVVFEISDLYQLTPDKRYDHLFGGFIWSHILLQELNLFCEKLFSLVPSGGRIILIDNNYVESSNTPITSRDDEGNTYQTRTLENGLSFNILKNFPAPDTVRNYLYPFTTDVQLVNMKHFWIAIATKK